MADGQRRGAAARALRRAAVAGVGGVAAQVALRAVLASPAAAGLERTNHRGRTLSLAAGPALATGAAAAAALGAGEPATAAAALLVGVSTGAVGLYDDVAGQRPEQRRVKGFRGHLGALRSRQLTSGLVKIAGIGAAGLAGAVLVDARSTAGPIGRTVDAVLATGVIAGAANLANLFDLRPGRAIKVAVAAGGPLLLGPGGGLAAGTLGAAGALLPADLGERVMLGDGGANAMGALLGLALTRSTGRAGRLVALVGLAGLTLASEKVSFTKVIESTPVLRALDGLGRLPASD